MYGLFHCFDHERGAKYAPKEGIVMFKDLFDFAKKRSLKESVGFFIVHGGIAFSVITLLKVAGV